MTGCWGDNIKKKGHKGPLIASNPAREMTTMASV